MSPIVRELIQTLAVSAVAFIVLAGLSLFFKAEGK